MKKGFLIVLFLLAALSGYSQKKSEILKDTLVWREGDRLTKEDFKGKPTKGSYYGLTDSGILLDTKEENGRIKFVVETILHTKGSFLKTDSEYGLKHEQGHFDITEIFARRLRQKIATKDYMKSKKMESEISAIYKQVDNELFKEQKLYDRETEHSINMVKQEFWNKKIADELVELKDYSSTEVDVMKK